MREHQSAGSGTFFPWCSTAFAALCVVASLWAAGEGASVVARAQEQLARAEAEVLRHPYLEAGALLQQRVGAERLLHARIEYQKELSDRGLPGVPPRLLQNEQDELDGQLRELEGTLAALPARRFGVDPLAGPSAALLTHTPFHAGLAHLIGNVALLLFLGLYLESAWGRARFLAIAAFAAVGAGLGYVFTAPQLTRPFVGTSGMLAGLLPLFALYYVKARGDGFYWVGLVLGTVWLVLPPLLGWQWSLDAGGSELLAAAPPPHLTFGAYAGAALGAFAIYQILRLTGLPAFSPDVEEATPSHAPDAGRIARLRARGKLEDAFVVAGAWARREPESIDATLTLRELAQQLGRPAAARAALLRAVRLELHTGLLAAAADHWLELAASGVPREAEPAMLIRLASLFAETGDKLNARRALRAALDNAGDATRAVVAGRVARAARDLDPQLAHDAAWRALQSTEIELEERHSLEELLAVVVPKLQTRESEPVAATGGARPVPIDIETRVRVLDAIEAVPVELDESGVHFSTAAGQKKLMRYDRIEAVSVAAVQGLSERPVLIVDLVLDWKAAAGTKLRVIRLRADRFDPRRVVPGVGSQVEAMRQMVSIVLARSKGTPLPDADAARGMPFASFAELALYQRLVLMAEGPAAQAPAQGTPEAQREASRSAAPEEDDEKPAAPPEMWELKS
jgi:membrane associated rhomboid family serine protease